MRARVCGLLNFPLLPSDGIDEHQSSFLAQPTPTAGSKSDFLLFLLHHKSN